MKLLGLFNVRRWRAAYHFIRALSLYDRGEYTRSMAHLNRALLDPNVRTSSRVAFKAVLMVRTRRPPREVLNLHLRIAAGTFRSRSKDDEYAKALSLYWAGYLLNSPDLVARWVEAYRLKPTSWYATTYLSLPPNPVILDSAGSGTLNEVG